MKYIIIVLVTIFIGCSRGESTELLTRDVTTNLDTPWEILWGPDGYIWMTERYGRISRVNPESGELIPLITINDVIEGSERGLMGMALHPDFTSYPYVYVVYDYTSTGGGTTIKVVRYQYNNAKLENPVIIFNGIHGEANHNGSRLWILGDKLFVTTGDAQVGSNAQDTSSLNGKILRMNLDGTIPSDNPFPGSYIWSYGHRNPQGLVVANGIMYESEHGPDTDDELNIIEKGRNYGWPNVKGYCDLAGEKTFCEQNNVVEPILSMYPNSTIATAGIDYYDNDLIPEWENSILLVALKGSQLLQIKLDDSRTKVAGTNVYFQNKFGRLRDMCISPDGRVFIAVSNRDGRGIPASIDDRIIEIKPKGSSVGGNNKLQGSLFRAYPNPSDGGILFETKYLSIETAKIEIFDCIGKKIRSISLNSFKGNNEIWDAKDESGNSVTPGVFIAVLNSAGLVLTTMLNIIR